MPQVEDLDAVVIGANLRGLVTAYILNSLGYRAVLLEKAPTVGGVDGSFETPDGTRFEYGLHVLDDMRSEVATRLFTHVVDEAVHRIKLRRAIVLRNRITPYAASPAEMPAELRGMFESEEIVDDLGDELPTRARLARFYGRPFTDLIFDEVLPSYPSEQRHSKFGIDESRLLTNIYPWFFPRARRKPRSGDGSREFHDQLRDGVDQYILYPREGGFGGFAKGFLRQLDPRRIEVLTNAHDVHLEVERGTHTVRRVDALGRRFRAAHYFWATSWKALCGVLDLPCQEIATDRVLLGSFRWNRPVNTDYHELLVGDPTHQLNRVYFPARFRESNDPLMQVEYVFPRAEERPLDGDHWRRTWVENAGRLGLIDDRHRVETFDFKTFCMHFNAFGMEGEPLRDADPSLLRADSNVRPVVPSMANLNVNAYVPRVIDYVTSSLTRGAALPNNRPAQ
jgi:hypothetical protein